MSNAFKFFSYDPSNGGYGFELHDTAEKAKARAQSCIPELKSYDGFWEEEVNQVCWGVLKEVATQVNRVNIDESGNGDDGEKYDADFDYMCDYELKPFRE